MTVSTQEPPITEYERAVCYYTLPRVLTPVSAGLIAAYAICFLEAVAALAYGVIRDDSTWTTWGTIGLAAIIVLGVVAFLARSFLNEVRKKRLLTTAEGIPDPTSGFDDLPDPFEGHVLLRCPQARADERVVEDNTGKALYRVERESRSRASVRDAATGEEAFSIELKRRGVSFTLHKGAAANAVVTKGGAPVAIVRERFSLMAPRVDIDLRPSKGPVYTVRGGSVHLGEVAVGRTYGLRQHTYLDIRVPHVNPGVLAYFIVFA